MSNTVIDSLWSAVMFVLHFFITWTVFSTFSNCIVCRFALRYIYRWHVHRNSSYISVSNDAFLLCAQKLVPYVAYTVHHWCWLNHLPYVHSCIHCSQCISSLLLVGFGPVFSPPFSAFVLFWSFMYRSCTRWMHSSRKRVKHGKKRKKSRFFGFWKNVKNVKNVEVITYRSIGLKTTVTTLNQFCCPSRNYQVICGAYFNRQWTILT